MLWFIGFLLIIVFSVYLYKHAVGMVTFSSRCQVYMDRLTDSCPDYLLDEARKQRYGNFYKTVVSGSSALGTFIMELIGLDAPGGIESLTTLDQTSHVPYYVYNDDYMNVGKSVHEFVTFVLQECLKGSQNETNYTMLPFSLAHIGDIPSNTKVGDLDQFDYLVVSNCSRIWRRHS